MKSVDERFDCCRRYYYFSLHSKLCQITNNWEIDTDPYESKNNQIKQTENFT